MSSEPQNTSNGDAPATGESDSKEPQESEENADKRSEAGAEESDGKPEVTEGKTAPEGAKKDAVEEAKESEKSAAVGEVKEEIVEAAALGEVQEEFVDEALGQAFFQEDAAGVVAALALEELSDESDADDIEKSQMSSGSEDEELVKARKIVLQRMQEVMTKPSDIQDPNRPRVMKDDDKEHMDEYLRAARDKAILQSMAVAERGYITRLRAPSLATDKLTLSQYQIRPGLEEKFKSVLVKEMIHTVLNDELGGKTYTEEEAKVWSQSIANTVRMKVKEMGFPRYKFVVQCVIGEEHGAGVKIGSRCLWDADTDNYASDTFLNETIFCMTAVYAIYFY